jgi:hypothetical protein
LTCTFSPSSMPMTHKFVLFSPPKKQCWVFLSIVMDIWTKGVWSNGNKLWETQQIKGLLDPFSDKDVPLLWVRKSTSLMRVLWPALGEG